MNLEVLTRTGRGRNRGEKVAALTPSDSHGHFVSRDRHFAQERVSGILYLILPPADVAAIEAGERTLSDFVELGGDSTTFQPRDGVDLVAPTDPDGEVFAYLRDATEYKTEPVMVAGQL